MEQIEYLSHTNSREKLLEELKKKRLYDSKEVCKILGISLPSLRRAIKLGRIKTVKVGHFIRIPTEEIEKLVGSEDTLSVKETANLLNVGVIMVRKLIKNNSLQAIRLANKGPWRIPINAIQKVMSNFNKEG